MTNIKLCWWLMSTCHVNQIFPSFWHGKICFLNIDFYCGSEWAFVEHRLEANRGLDFIQLHPSADRKSQWEPPLKTHTCPLSPASEYNKILCAHIKFNRVTVKTCKTVCWYVGGQCWKYYPLPVSLCQRALLKAALVALVGLFAHFTTFVLQI